MRLFSLMLFVLACSVQAKTIKIAVIDTGYDFDSTWKFSNLEKPKLCKYGHRDFTNTSIKDTHSHGTHISSLIAKGNSNIDYCIVSLKFYDDKSFMETIDSEINAIKYAIKLKVDIINLSLAGYSYSKLECSIISKALDNGIRVVAAAGNESYNLHERKVYPAMCDKRVLIVMSGKGERDPSSFSNYAFDIGAYMVDGEQVKGLGINNSEKKMSGTSQATALLTSRLLRGKK